MVFAFSDAANGFGEWKLTGLAPVSLLGDIKRGSNATYRFVFDRDMSCVVDALRWTSAFWAILSLNFFDAPEIIVGHGMSSFPEFQFRKQDKVCYRIVGHSGAFLWVGFFVSTLKV